MGMRGTHCLRVWEVSFADEGRSAAFERYVGYWECSWDLRKKKRAYDGALVKST